MPQIVNQIAQQQRSAGINGEACEATQILHCVLITPPENCGEIIVFGIENGKPCILVGSNAKYG